MLMHLVLSFGFTFTKEYPARLTKARSSGIRHQQGEQGKQNPFTRLALPDWPAEWIGHTVDGHLRVKHGW